MKYVNPPTRPRDKKTDSTLDLSKGSPQKAGLNSTIVTLTIVTIVLVIIACIVILETLKL